MITHVFYHVPEDNDDLKQLNCFVIPKEIEKVTLIDIKQHFPLAGSYHFRFQFSF